LKRATQSYVAAALPSETDLSSKLVLLTLSFPRLRIIWSSSAYATSDIFADLKHNHEEPDPSKAVLVGADEAEGAAGRQEIEGSFNQASQEVLLNLPGMNTKNFRYVMSRVHSLEDLVGLGLEEIQELIGVEAGRKLYTFVHRNVWTDAV
jgi:DNA excision repair protein ERCC-4